MNCERTFQFPVCKFWSSSFSQFAGRIGCQYSDDTDFPNFESVDRNSAIHLVAPVSSRVVTKNSNKNNEERSVS
jgi:hypothetical protein